jgi:C4-dicarboxylate-specific signal transduction histidine kinase
VAAALRARFPEVTIQIAADGAPAALVAGGESTLHRILANLVVNACEGDGASGARWVDVRARAVDAERLVIEVDDDGPGLPAHVVDGLPGAITSTKPTGTGLGMGLVHGVVKASGGTITRHNPSGGGTRVVVELRVAP